MTTMISAIIVKCYEAFRIAGVSEDKARQAAEAMSAENLATKRDVDELKADNRLFRWMLGFNLTFTMAVTQNYLQSPGMPYHRYHPF